MFLFYPQRFLLLVYLMNNSMKAALLSAFIFPGAGHFFLKKHVSGAALVATAFAALYLIISNAVERALQIAEKIQSGEVQLDVAAIAELVSKQPTGTGTQVLNIATAVLFISWLIGIVDSYRVGRV
jgi:hypothetical protein